MFAFPQRLGGVILDGMSTLLGRLDCATISVLSSTTLKNKSESVENAALSQSTTPIPLQAYLSRFRREIDASTSFPVEIGTQQPRELPQQTQ